MGSRNQSKVHQLQCRARCTLVSQHRNRHLDSVLAGASVVEIDHVDKAKMPVDRHILPGWIVRFPSMLVGGFLILRSVCIASIVRVPYIARLSLVDQTWSDIDAFIWSVAELSLAIVSACLPTFRPLFLHVFYGGYTATPKCQIPERQSPGKKISADDEISDIASISEHSHTKTADWV